MKRLLLIASILMSFLLPVSSKTAVSDIERIGNYDILCRMFDSPFNESEISRFMYGKNLEFYYEIVSEKPDLKDYVFDYKSDNGEYLNVQLPESFSLGEGLPSPYRLSISSDNDEITMAYYFKQKSPREENREVEILRHLLNVNDALVVYDEKTGMFEGPYGHNYNLGQSGNEIILSCKMPRQPVGWYSIPSYYIDGIGYQILPKNSPCNKGAEPFNEFIKKFNSNSKFRSERIGAWSNTSIQYYTQITGTPIGSMPELDKIVLESLKECKLLPLTGHVKKKKIKDADILEDLIYDCGQWFFPTENRVIYSGWKYTDSGDDSDSIILLFERIDGEWYCTLNYYFGSRMNDLVNAGLEKLTNQE